MNSQAALIDEIVKRVLEKLQGPDRGAPRDFATGKSQSTPDASGIVIEEAIVTAKLLSERAAGRSRVTIGERAILTPAAVDLASSQKITLLRRAAPLRARGRHWQAILSSSTRELAGALDRLDASGLAGRRFTAALPQEAAALATGALCRGEADFVLVFSGEPEQVACLANRNERVRAAVAQDRCRTRHVRASMDANLLAVDPAGRPTFQLVGIVREFVGA
jgi:hypothetical protein